MIELPANFTSQVGTSASELIGNFSPYITMILGTLLAVFAIGAIITWIRH